VCLYVWLVWHARVCVCVCLCVSVCECVCVYLSVKIDRARNRKHEERLSTTSTWQSRWSAWHRSWSAYLSTCIAQTEHVLFVHFSLFKNASPRQHRRQELVITETKCAGAYNHPGFPRPRTAQLLHIMASTGRKKTKDRKKTTHAVKITLRTCRTAAYNAKFIKITY